MNSKLKLIFVTLVAFSNAAEEKEQAAANLEQPRGRAELAEPEQPYRGGIAGITFPNVTKDQVPLDVQKSLARMRCNFAHCSRQDLTRWLFSCVFYSERLQKLDKAKETR